MDQILLFLLFLCNIFDYDDVIIFPVEITILSDFKMIPCTPQFCVILRILYARPYMDWSVERKIIVIFIIDILNIAVTLIYFLCSVISKND